MKKFSLFKAISLKKNIRNIKLFTKIEARRRGRREIINLPPETPQLIQLPDVLPPILTGEQPDITRMQPLPLPEGFNEWEISQCTNKELWNFIRLGRTKEDITMEDLIRLCAYKKKLIRWISDVDRPAIETTMMIVQCPCSNIFLSKPKVFKRESDGCPNCGIRVFQDRRRQRAPEPADYVPRHHRNLPDYNPIERHVVNVKEYHIKQLLKINKTYGFNTIKCYCCNIEKWRNKPLYFVAEIDHINGVSTDNHPSNLRILCGICHSQTMTRFPSLRNLLSPRYEFKPEDRRLYPGKPDLVDPLVNSRNIIQNLDILKQTSAGLRKLKNVGIIPVNEEANVPFKKELQEELVNYTTGVGHPAINNLTGKLFRSGLKAPRCEDCGVRVWRGLDMRAFLETDHADGISFHYDLNNLSIKCRSCHTFSHRNVSNEAEAQINNLITSLRNNPLYFDQP